MPLPTPRRHRNTALTSPARRLLCTHKHTHTHAAQAHHNNRYPLQRRWRGRCRGGGERRQTAIVTATAEYSVQSCAHRAHGSFGAVKKPPSSPATVIDVAREPVQRYYRLCAASTPYPNNNDDREKGTAASARAR